MSQVSHGPACTIATSGRLASTWAGQTSGQRTHLSAIAPTVPRSSRTWSASMIPHPSAVAPGTSTTLGSPSVAVLNPAAVMSAVESPKNATRAGAGAETPPTVAAVSAPVEGVDATASPAAGASTTAAAAA